jgi:hypothetical protein
MERVGDSPARQTVSLPNKQIPAADSSPTVRTRRDPALAYCCAFVIFVRALDDFSHACAARVRDVARSSRPEPCAALLQLQPRARPRRRRAGEAFMAGPCRTGRRGIRFPRPRERPASVSSRHLNLGLPCCMLEREGLRPPFGTGFFKVFQL